MEISAPDMPGALFSLSGYSDTTYDHLSPFIATHLWTCHQYGAWIMSCPYYTTPGMKQQLAKADAP